MTIHARTGQALSQPIQVEEWQEQYAYAIGMQAYVYGFPWIYNTQLRWLWATPEGQKLSQEAGKPDLYAPINTFHHVKQLASPPPPGQTGTGGSPNCDTLYSTAWLDVTDDPIVISVPAVTDRFYCIEMVSFDADNFAYVGTRSTGVQANNFLIAGPGWNSAAPADVLDVLPRSRTSGIFLLGRTGVNNTLPEDLSAANAIQQQYRLTPLSVWTSTETPPLGPVLVPGGADYNKTEGAWLTMNKAMTQNPPGLPPGIAQDQLLRLFATVGIGPNQDVAAQPAPMRLGLQRAAGDALAMLKNMSKGRGKQVNGWTYPPLDTGRAGQSSDFITRGAVQSLGGICANDPAEAVYINVFTDKDGQPLNGQELYTITFEAGNFPPCDAAKHGFWSVTIYDSSYNLVSGSLNYSINGYYPDYQKRDANGAMTIWIQPNPLTAPADGSYWLQSPSGNDTFYLILRVYVPDPTVSATQTYAPPQIVRHP
jgi:hypothetical protein